MFILKQCFKRDTHREIERERHTDTQLKVKHSKTNGKQSLE